LRPLGFALPEPLWRPADPNSPGRIANSSYNRSVMGEYPSAGRPRGWPSRGKAARWNREQRGGETSEMGENALNEANFAETMSIVEPQ